MDTAGMMNGLPSCPMQSYDPLFEPAEHGKQLAETWVGDRAVACRKIWEGEAPAESHLSDLPIEGWLNDHEIEVAVFSRFAPRIRPEQNDFRSHGCRVQEHRRCAVDGVPWDQSRFGCVLHAHVIASSRYHIVLLN
jgi:hypothetical protein